MSELELLRQIVGECLDYMENEMHWEYFRTEFLYHNDEPKKNASAENARLLKNFLAQPHIKPIVEAAKLKYFNEMRRGA